MTKTQNQLSVAVIGGGISGLTSAYLLKQRGFDITLFEQGSQPGGKIRSYNENDWLVERGPNTIMARSEKLWNLIEQLDLHDQVVRTGSEAARRFIVKNGRPVAIPQSLMQFLTTNLFSTRAKFRLLKEPFIDKGLEKESIAAFFERRLGKEVVDYAINPFVAGIYAGDPEQLSIEHTLSKVYEFEQKYGSILKGAVKSRRSSSASRGSSANRKGLISFKNGAQQLPQKLREKLGKHIQFNSPVTSFVHQADSWSLTTNDDQTHFGFDALLYTAPVHQFENTTVQVEKSELIPKLTSIPYAPIAVVSLGVRVEQIQHPLNGFGMLVPEVEPFNMLGCLFSSSLFEGRAPEEHALLTCFVGGQRNPEYVKRSDKELLDLVSRDLQKLLGYTDNPVFTSIYRWEKAIPQYGLDHQNYLDIMDQLESANPGYFLTGNYRHEVSVPGCIEQAYETAERIASFFESRV